MKPDLLQKGKFFHIYTHGAGNRDVFKEPDNYEHFLRLYNDHISQIADTYAWVLMPNHLHFVVRFHDSLDLTGFQNLSGLDKPLHQYFSNLFNAYTKSFNKWHGERGSLFERPFQRKMVDSIEYLKRLVLYVHNNPVHHGFSSHPVEYPWSSYLTCISVKPTKLKRDEVLGWFDNQANFISESEKTMNFYELEKWLGFGK